MTVCGDSRPAAAPRWSTVVRMQEDSSEGRGGFDQKMFDYYANPETFKDTTLTVMEFPNPVLREVGKPVTDFDDKLAKLCEDMFTILYDSKGVGLSAPQVGLSLRVFVYNTDPSSPLRKMREVAVINPKITDYCAAGELDAWTDVDIEGCLSSRAECCRGHVRRAKVIEVEYQDVQGCVPLPPAPAPRVPAAPLPRCPASPRCPCTACQACPDKEAARLRGARLPARVRPHQRRPSWFDMRLHCSTTPPQQLTWCLLGLGPLLRTPERHLGLLEACRGP